MLAVIATAVFALFIWAMIKAGGWGAANPLIVTAAIFSLAFIWLLFYHRRRIHEIEALEIDTLGRFKRVNRAVSWPRWCVWCGVTVHGPKALRIHNEPDSYCSAKRLGAERDALAAELADQADEWEAERDQAADQVTWTATVNEAPSGAVDSLTDDPAAIGAGDE